MMNDLISRQAAIDALWKALFAYEDKTEKQFLESDELDIRDWMLHRIFVQNMNNIDRETILNLSSAQPELDEWCTDCKEYDQERHCCPRWNRVIRETLKDVENKIVRCKDCKWYGRADKSRFYRGTDCLNHRIATIVPDKDYCSRAERRTDEQSDRQTGGD